MSVQPTPDPRVVVDCTINYVDLGSLSCGATVSFDDGTTQQITWPVTIVSAVPVADPLPTLPPPGPPQGPPGPPPPPPPPGGGGPGPASPPGL